MSSYFYKWCKKGHLTHNERDHVTASRYKECGDVFVDKCLSCNDPLSFFQDCEYSWYIPDKPNNCKKCGHSFPWKPSWLNKICESLSGWWRNVPVKLQVTLIIAFLLTVALIAGILKIDQVIKLAQLWTSG